MGLYVCNARGEGRCISTGRCCGAASHGNDREQECKAENTKQEAQAFSESHRNAIEGSDMCRGGACCNRWTKACKAVRVPAQARAPAEHCRRQARKYAFSARKLRAMRCFWKYVAPDSLDFSPCVFDCFGFSSATFQPKFPTHARSSFFEALADKGRGLIIGGLA